MAISNYGELKTAVANWLVRDELTSRIPEFIRMGEARLWADLRLRFMEVTANATITISTQTTALPTRWLQGRRIYIATTGRVEYKTPVEFWEIHANRPTARPDVYTIEGENFVWGPLPDAGYTAVVHYFQQPAILSADADTNGLFTLAPNMYLLAALIESAPFLLNDARVQIWAAMYDDMKDRLHAANERDRYSGDVRTQTKAAQVT